MKFEWLRPRALWTRARILLIRLISLRFLSLDMRERLVRTGKIVLILCVLVLFAYVGTWGAIAIVASFDGSMVLPQLVRLDPFDWTAVNALAATLTFLINALLLATVVIGFRSVREGQASRSAHVLGWAINQMDAVKEDERRVRLADSNFETWDDDVRSSANRVCNAYQRMCYFARQGLISPVHFRKMWGINICIYWRILKPYVESERLRFQDQPTAADGAYLRADFEVLAEQFTRHFNRQNRNLLKGYEINGRTRETK